MNYQAALECVIVRQISPQFTKYAILKSIDPRDAWDIAINKLEFVYKERRGRIPDPAKIAIANIRRAVAAGFDPRLAYIRPANQNIWRPSK